MYNQKRVELVSRSVWQKTRLCPILLCLIICLTLFGLTVLYSASDQSQSILLRQSIRLGAAFLVMIAFAQIPCYRYRNWAPFFFMVGCVLLIGVLLAGKIGKGAQRWLDLGFFKFQPSELMKLFMPMFLAWFYSQQALPARIGAIIKGALFLLLPCLIIAKQPDLGTAIMVFLSGFVVIFISGIRYQLLLGVILVTTALTPVIWHTLHDYQKERVLTFVDPERDPLGSGYHIIQSKIAIGSGGMAGKGWLNGTQSNLNFLPEHTTDFIFAVICEEFGFIGAFITISLILLISLRALYISISAYSYFPKFLGIAISMNYFFSSIFNIGMVTGLLPVVGIPLPLVSYGGSYMLMIFASFGILMSIHHEKNMFAADKNGNYSGLKSF
jgi:rod shape determining protein RodA